MIDGKNPVPRWEKNAIESPMIGEPDLDIPILINYLFTIKEMNLKKR